MSGRTRISCLSPACPAPASSIAIRAPRARRSRIAAASESSSGTNSCSVISTTSPARFPRERLADDVGGQRRRADVDRQVGVERAPERLEGGADRGRLELGAEPAAVRLGEPDVGGALARPGEARQRLVADDAPGTEADHRLEHGGDRPVECQQLLDLGALALGPVRGRVLGVEAAGAPLAAALGPVQRAVGELARGSRRPRRRAGRPRCPAEPLSSKPVDGDRRDRVPGALGDGERGARVRAREDQARTPRRRSARRCRRCGSRRAARRRPPRRTSSP